MMKRQKYLTKQQHNFVYGYSGHQFVVYFTNKQLKTVEKKLDFGICLQPVP